MHKAIIIDDERLARNELKKLLQDFPQIEIVDEAANAAEGVEKVDLHNPDLIFLDIQMPGKTGFDLLQDLDKAPHVIFTTAYDEYALKAFEVNALDYLMKPIEPGRLADALQKMQKTIAEKGSYAVIFDKSSDLSMLYANPKYDKSDEVLDAMGLKKGYKAADAAKKPVKTATPKPSTTGNTTPEKK